MDLKVPRVLLLVAVVALISLSSAASPTADDLVAELEALRSQSPSGVIHLNDSSVARFLTSVPFPRPYTLLVFFFGASKPDPHLHRLRSDFARLSSSFAAHHASSPASSRLVFFCDLEYQESEFSFSLFGVTSVPDARHVGPQHLSLRDSDRMDPSEFSKLAASMDRSVEAETSPPADPIVRPSPISPRRQIAVLAVALLISAPFLIKRILEGKTMLHDRRLWMGLTVSVYFLSVAGIMHNIIRKIPMYVRDRNDPNRLIFFVKGYGQLGTEVLAVGFLYTIVGLIVAFATHVLVRMRNEKVQSGIMLVAMMVAFWAVRKVIYLHNWKTDYDAQTFWPTW